MYRFKLMLKWSVAACAVLSLAQCKGGKSESGTVEVSAVPDDPIVITADTMVSGTVVKGPWFKFRVTLTNGSTKQLEIVAMTAKIYAANSSTPADWAVDPSSANKSTDTTICQYDSFGIWDPNQTKAFSLNQSGSTTCTSNNPSFYVEGLKTVPNQQVFRYRVVVKPIGYFLEDGLPAGRFDKSFTFYTR